MLVEMNDPSPAGPPPQPGRPGRLRHALLWPLLAVGLLWVLAAWQVFTGGAWVHLGVFPRTLAGLPGVLTAPLIHASWSHLLANTPALLGLGALALYGYPRATRHAVPMIWLASGIGVWLFARESFHIGISGLTHGLMFYVIVIGFLRRDRLSIALALIVFLLFGGMASGIIPQETGVSFEYHLFGAIAGVLAAAVLFRLDPVPVRARREEEQDEAGDAEPAGTDIPGENDDPGNPRNVGRPPGPG
jgi:membrane associated rhomboid family serine protease